MVSDAVVPPFQAGAATSELPVLFAPRFVGRERELAVLDRALATPPALVLVEGEAGIGKSRLLREYLDTRDPGRRALMASAPPVRQPYTLGPVVDALQQATDGVGRSDAHPGQAFVNPSVR